MADTFATRTHEKMREVLLDPNAEGPGVHYWMIRGGSEKGNITVWESGLVGREFIKTYGHYHVDALPETYWILSGEGIALLQKKTGDGSDPSKRIGRASRRKREDRPAGTAAFDAKQQEIVTYARVTAA